MSIALNWFKFTKKTSAKEFYKYKIINNNPYDKNFKHLGNSIRYRLLQLKENKVYGRKIFIYADSSNTYLYTYDKIINIPCFKDNGIDAELKLESHELIPLTKETIDLYSHWMKLLNSVFYNWVLNIKKNVCFSAY